jgi:hypothetical protein
MAGSPGSPSGPGSGPGPGPGPGAAGAGAVRWFLVRVAAAIAATAIVLFVGGFLIGHQASGPTAAWAKSSGQDALWLGHGWLADPGAGAGGAGGGSGSGGRDGYGGNGGGAGGGGLAALTARIRGSGVSDVYVLAGQLSAGGQLDPAQYAGAAAFLRSFHAALPHVRVCAWLNGTVGQGQLDLDDTAVRAAVVASAAALLHAGFGGISYDLTPVASGDSGLLNLLDATRALHPGVLSVDAPKVEPLAGMGLPAALIMRRPVFWTSGYLGDVASRVSQVALMSYDTGVPVPSWYSGYVARETGIALRAVPAGVGLVIGLPAFAGSTLGHHGSAETVPAAIHGVRIALTGSHHPRSTLGVGLYTADSATAQDWSAYQSGWVAPGGSG